MQNGSYMEAWLFIILIIASMIGVVVIGIGVVVLGTVAIKFYRKFRPFEEENSSGFSISISHHVQRDSFFKIFIVGLVLASPVFYLVYLSI